MKKKILISFICITVLFVILLLIIHLNRTKVEVIIDYDKSNLDAEGVNQLDSLEPGTYLFTLSSDEITTEFILYDNRHKGKLTYDRSYARAKCKDRVLTIYLRDDSAVHDIDVLTEYVFKIIVYGKVEEAMLYVNDEFIVNDKDLKQESNILSQ